MENIEYLYHPWENSIIQGYSTPGWYYWDEIWFNCYGPFSTREEAAKHLKMYAEDLDNDRLCESVS